LKSKCRRQFLTLGYIGFFSRNNPTTGFLCVSHSRQPGALLVRRRKSNQIKISARRQREKSSRQLHILCVQRGKKKKKKLGRVRASGVCGSTVVLCLFTFSVYIKTSASGHSKGFILPPLTTNHQCVISYSEKLITRTHTKKCQKQ
jgi:hypothetical protein